uniref:Uncharacterized protein n=1 Tax=Arundo donax TaxID=35708 RepID=A0A0A9BEC7_ARUDO
MEFVRVQSPIGLLLDQVIRNPLDSVLETGAT